MPTATLKEQIRAVKLFKSGTPQKELCATYNISRTTLYKWIKRHEKDIDDPHNQVKSKIIQKVDRELHAIRAAVEMKRYCLKEAFYDKIMEMLQKVERTADLVRLAEAYKMLEDELQEPVPGASNGLNGLPPMQWVETLNQQINIRDGQASNSAD